MQGFTFLRGRPVRGRPRKGVRLRSAYVPASLNSPTDSGIGGRETCSLDPQPVDSAIVELDVCPPRRGAVLVLGGVLPWPVGRELELSDHAVAVGLAVVGVLEDDEFTRLVRLADTPRGCDLLPRLGWSSGRHGDAERGHHSHNDGPAAETEFAENAHEPTDHEAPLSEDAASAGWTAGEVVVTFYTSNNGDNMGNITEGWAVMLNLRGIRRIGDSTARRRCRRRPGAERECLARRCGRDRAR
jgi:hypothetical protein